MNWDKIEGNWTQMRGRVKEAWGDITDSDLQKIEGKRDRLAGILQERYGKEKDKVDKEIDS
ncbi:MAG: CsbD family protein, partial [Alphaproteobacteria bacterium HGW-Alphaproteobacteria-12]